MDKDVRSSSPPIWVDEPAGFRAMLAHLRGEPALAVDTESNSLYAYRERICLIQISVPEADYLIDPLALHDLSGLEPLLADPAILKVLHGADYDLSMLQRDFGFRLTNLFDTMWASRILGWPAHGLAALLESHFGVHLDKKYQRANWGLRPLPPEQLDYARLDTHFLLPLQEIQAQELEASARWPQAEHRFTELAEADWEAKGFDANGFWRLSGARDLDDEGRGVLQAVYLFREKQAEVKDRPPFKVLSNKAMLALSTERPRDLGALRRVKGVPAWLVRRHGRELLAAVRQGGQHPLSWADRPRSANGNNRASNGPHGGRPSPECKARFEALRTWRNSTAEAKGVEPDIILNNQALWAVATANPRNHAELADDGLLAPWQADEFGEDLLAVVRDKR